MTKLYFIVFISELLAITYARPYNDNFDFFGGLDSTFDPFGNSDFGDFPSSGGSFPEYYDTSSSLDPFNDLVMEDDPFKNFLPLGPEYRPMTKPDNSIIGLVYGPDFLFRPNFMMGLRNKFGPNFPFATG